MILFFRRIREQLASDNKPIKYLRYAIGEIVLVVIGILIAIQINNLNEDRKNERRIISILSEVQNDLSLDILKVDELIEYYWEKDSLIYLALLNKLTYEDYKGLPVGLFSLTSEYDVLRIHDNSYNNLMRYIDHIPDKYKPIINQLNKLYTLHIVGFHII